MIEYGIVWSIESVRRGPLAQALVKGGARGVY